MTNRLAMTNCFPSLGISCLTYSYKSGIMNIINNNNNNNNSYCDYNKIP